MNITFFVFWAIFCVYDKNELSDNKKDEIIRNDATFIELIDQSKKQDDPCNEKIDHSKNDQNKKPDDPINRKIEYSNNDQIKKLEDPTNEKIDISNNDQSKKLDDPSNEKIDNSNNEFKKPVFDNSKNKYKTIVVKDLSSSFTELEKQSRKLEDSRKENIENSNDPSLSIQLVKFNKNLKDFSKAMINNKINNRKKVNFFLEIKENSFKDNVYE